MPLVSFRSRAVFEDDLHGQAWAYRRHDRVAVVRSEGNSFEFADYQFCERPSITSSRRASRRPPGRRRLGGRTSA